ncbi:hypothetical protein A3860_14000 [Niastella vici]|uniref:Nucleoside phosphorylase domain-containing protein n=1 Tax=Niastella vici TaxID=1703345 RepID=A0A1V9G7G2_9BACT|nr:hypothetical protein [Niastella vici]OQP66589.1 hypothetical protein A3860_14000 [Niastella vici]
MRRNLHTGIIEFGKKITNTDTDVFLLLARKAACFTECLQELGLLKLNGHVTTDRILDMNLKWLKGKRITIVDDAIVSGTTIFETINVLKKAEVAAIQVTVISVNKDWYTPELLLDENGNSYLQEPYLKLKNDECIKLCSDIVTALSIFPRPYAVDFPLYTRIRVPESVLDNALINSCWDCDEITSSLQKLNSVISLTITPNKFFLEKLDEDLGFQISGTSICKLRLYGKLIENNRSTYSRSRKVAVSNLTTRNVYHLKILPIVILKPISAVAVNDIFNSILSHFGDEVEILTECFTSSQSKLRLIQHIAAHYLGRIWVQEIARLTDSKISLHQDNRALEFLYPPRMVTIVRAIFSQADNIFKAATFTSGTHYDLNNTKFESQIKEVNLLSINAKLAEPFIDLYYSKELKSRELVKKHHKEVFNNEEYKTILTRLKKGFSVTYLQNLVSDYASCYDTEKLVSLFLDRSIDMGIVVPITGEENGILFRAYRHGEDVIFSELEEKVCILMLEEFSKSANRTTIPHIWTEKLLVLLLKIGVHKKLLREFIYDNPPKGVYRIVSVKNFMFGQVAAEQVMENDKQLSPVYLNEDQKSQWLSTILLEKKYLSEAEDDFYKVEEIDASDVNANIRMEAENIGDIFGMLYANEEMPRLVQKDMVILTSCLNPNDIAASMAAEISIFKNRWKRYKESVNLQARNQKQYYTIIRDLRHKNKMWTAVNSGQDKFVDFKTKRGHQIIEDITTGLLNVSKVTARNWRQFWSENMEWDENSIDENLKVLIDRQAAWLFKANIYLRILDSLFRKLLQLSGEDKLTLNYFNTQLEYQSQNVANLRRQVKDSKLQKENNPLHERLQQELRKASYSKDKIADEIKDIIQGFEPVVEEVNGLMSLLEQHTGENVITIKKYINDVRLTLALEEINAFKSRRFISTTLRKLDELHDDARLILEKVDLIVSPFGKVEYAAEYPHAFWVHYDYVDDYNRRQIDHIISEVLLEFEKEIFRYKEQNNLPPSFYAVSEGKNKLNSGRLIIGRGAFAKRRLIELIGRISAAIKGKCTYFFVLFTDLPSNSTITVQAKNNNNIKFGFFFDRAEPVVEHLTNLTCRPVFATVSLSKDQHDVLVNDIEKDSGRLINFSTSGIVTINSTITEQIIIGYFDMVQPVSETFDIGIITIVPPEKRAIDKILKNFKAEHGKKTVRKYSKGTLQGLGGIQHSVVMTQQLIQGNESVAPAYRDIVDEFNPKLMVLFGVGGCIDDKMKLCDVCIANQVIDYDKRKEVADGEIKERGSTYRVSAKLQIFINEFFNEYGEFCRLEASPDSLEKTFLVQPGPIGSGNAVVGNPSSAIKLWLKNFNSKTLALETEAVGMSNTFYEEELNHVVERIGVLIIRGISDHADFDKDDKWRIPASENAAIVLEKLVGLLPDLKTLLPKQDRI